MHQAVDYVMTNLCRTIKEGSERAPIPFRDFLGLAADKPALTLRNIFQLFYDMIYGYVGDGHDEYPDDPESINYVYYDCSSLFVEGTDHPFFADRIFANRLVNHVRSFKRGIQQNRIYIFKGPHGSGKSTFLNNLLMKFEHFTKTEEGLCYEVVWRLDRKKLGDFSENDAQIILTQLRRLSDESLLSARTNNSYNNNNANSVHHHVTSKEYLEVPCPSHDNPILLIPKSYRRDMLDDLIQDPEFKNQLFTQKRYEWVFQDNPCTICMSLYQALADICGSPSTVFDMLYARRYDFNKRLGEGISVYNPGDREPKIKVLTNQLLQSQLNTLLRDSNRVRYIFSRYAKTNNGIYALMDVKGHNKERFANLHGIISEGVHKVEDMEENVNSLFLALMNPEDEENIETQSFSDRITHVKIGYILDYNTEVKIYKDAFGDHIESHFLPRVLQNFAKVIISSRLKPTSEGLQEWIGDSEKYHRYCDKNLQLLKMDIYAGLIPPWLEEEDRKHFTAKRRRRVIGESEHEGDKGFSGRDSITIFNQFYSTYSKCGKLITMDTVYNFFNKQRKDLSAFIPDGFLDSLINFYNYTVLQEVKEALYYYNEEHISRDIKNYLFAINFDEGQVEQCIYTGEQIQVTKEFLEEIEARFLGPQVPEAQRRTFRKEIQRQYASKSLTEEMLVGGRAIDETEVYQFLHERYVHNLKEKVMDPFLKNDNFRRAVKDYSTSSFKTYDKRIQDEVAFLMKNLNEKYGYTEQGAKEVCIYVIDNKLPETFSRDGS